LERKKIRLHILRLERHIKKLKKRLEFWDDIKEIRLHRLEYETNKKSCILNDKQKITKRSKGRSGPETWKLRGAARPAWETYDFDIRYVDPNLEEQRKIDEKMKRVKNIFDIYKVGFGTSIFNGTSPLLLSICREYLSSLMQYAMLNIEAKIFAPADSTLLQIIDLEGSHNANSLTNARGCLMRLYMNNNQLEKARNLWERCPNDTSCWVLYSSVLIEYIRWRILIEDNSSEQKVEAALKRAIDANVYGVYYLAYYETFDKIMEYAEELDDERDSTLGQAIEYCNSEQIHHWARIDGALEWIHLVIQNALQRNTDDSTNNDIPSHVVKKKYLGWEEKLKREEETLQLNERERLRKYHMKGKINEKYKGNVKNCLINDETIFSNGRKDFLMYTGMFRTAMSVISLKLKG